MMKSRSWFAGAWDAVSTPGLAAIIGLGLLLWASFCGAQEDISDQFLDTFAIREALEGGQPVSELATALMDEGHSPQDVTREILLLKPDAAIEVATTMARRDPQEAPFVAAAISWMSRSQPAPIAAAVAEAVPEMASEVASHVAAAFPEQTAAVARAVVEAQPEQLTVIASTMGATVPENAAAVIEGIGPLLDSPLATVDFLVEMFAALPIPLAAFAGPDAGLVVFATGPAQKHSPPASEEAPGSGSTPAAEEVPPDEADPAPTLPAGSSLNPGEILETAAQGQAMVLLRDGTILTLFENGRFHFGAAAEVREAAGAGRVLGGLERGVLRVVGDGGEARSWRFDLGAGVLTLADADILLARGAGGAGVILLGGTAIWETATGKTTTLQPGRYRSDPEGRLGRPRTNANVYDWLGALALADIDLGNLAESSVWAAARLGEAMAPGNVPGQVQMP